MNSVLITTYRRFDTINRVCASWLDQADVGEVWLLDNTNGYARSHLRTEVVDNPKFKYWRLPADFKTRADYGVAPLTQGEYIWFADDDVVVHPGFSAEMIEKARVHATEAGRLMVGVIGRKFYGPRYIEDTSYFCAMKAKQPESVGFVGVCYAAHRSCALFDPREIPTNADDLYHSMVAFREVRKWVVPCTLYENLPSCEDAQAMCHNKELMRQRREVFAEWYIRYYHGSVV